MKDSKVWLTSGFMRGLGLRGNGYDGREGPQTVCMGVLRGEGGGGGGGGGGGVWGHPTNWPPTKNFG